MFQGLFGFGIPLCWQRRAAMISNQLYPIHSPNSLKHLRRHRTPTAVVKAPVDRNRVRRTGSPYASQPHTDRSASVALWKSRRLAWRPARSILYWNAPRHVQPGFLRASVICGMDRPSCPTFIFDSIGAITLERIFRALRKGVFSRFRGTMVANGPGSIDLADSSISLQSHSIFCEGSGN